jgi:hypothetical protein
MRIIKVIPPDEMILAFLKAEIDSNRWSQALLALLSNDNKSRMIIDKPNLNDYEENQYRKKLLGDFRGYDRNQYLFTDFPNDVKWMRVFLNSEELGKVKYMKYSYWDELSNHTRLAKIGAENVTNGKVVFKESNEGFLKAAEALKQGFRFPEIILVCKDENSDLVVLEGHQRITAYFLFPELMRDGLEVIVGLSHNMNAWGSY